MIDVPHSAYAIDSRAAVKLESIFTALNIKAQTMALTRGNGVIRLALTLILTTMLAGCGPAANPPKIYTPIPQSSDEGTPLLRYRVNSELVDFGKSFERTKPLGDGGIYFVQYKGGNLFLTLLGAATGGIGSGLMSSLNASLIDKKSGQIAASIGTDEEVTIATLTEQTMASLGLLSNDGVPLQPNLLILFGEDDKVRVSLIFTTGTTDDIERFFYEFRYVAHKAVVEGENQQQFFENVFAEVPIAIEALSEALPKIHTNQFGQGRKTVVESNFFAPFEGIPFEAYVLSDGDERHIVRVNAKNAFMTIRAAHGTHLLSPEHYEEVK